MYTISLSKFCVEFDKRLDYIPFVSSFSNLFAIFEKTIISSIGVFTSSYKGHYFSYLEEKSYLRCCLLLVPGFGNLLIIVYDALLKIGAEEVYKQAKACEQRGDFEGAVKLYARSANAGHIEAYFAYGECCEKGQGIEKNEALAFASYRKGSEEGHLKSCINMAFMLFEGRGVKSDSEAAIRQLEEVVKQEDGQQTKIFNLLARYYLQQKDKESRGISYLEQVALQDIETKLELAEIYQRGLYGSHDYKRAFHHCQAAVEADSDHSKAKWLLGFYYENGIGISLDFSRALGLYQEALQLECAKINKLLDLGCDLETYEIKDILNVYNRHFKKKYLCDVEEKSKQVDSLPLNELKFNLLYFDKSLRKRKQIADQAIRNLFNTYAFDVLDHIFNSLDDLERKLSFLKPNGESL